MDENSKRCTCGSEENAPDRDHNEKTNVATRSVNFASAIIDLMTKIMKLIEVIGSIMGG